MNFGRTRMHSDFMRISISKFVMTREIFRTGLALALVFLLCLRASAEGTIRVSEEGLTITGLVGSLLYENGTIRIDGRDKRQITRWESEISVGVLASAKEDEAAKEAESALQEVIEFVRRAGNVRISWALRPSDANVLFIIDRKVDVENQLPEKFQKLWSQIKSEASSERCKSRLAVDSEKAIDAAIIKIEPSPNTVITPCVRRGIGEALGIVGIPGFDVQTSMFSPDAGTSALTLYDLGALQVIYGDEIHAGMTYAEAFSKLYRLGQGAAVEIFPEEKLHWADLPASMVPGYQP